MRHPPNPDSDADSLRRNASGSILLHPSLTRLPKHTPHLADAKHARTAVGACSITCKQRSISYATGAAGRAAACAGAASVSRHGQQGARIGGHGRCPVLQSACRSRAAYERSLRCPSQHSRARSSTPSDSREVARNERGERAELAGQTASPRRAKAVSSAVLESCGTLRDEQLEHLRTSSRLHTTRGQGGEGGSSRQAVRGTTTCPAACMGRTPQGRRRPALVGKEGGWVGGRRRATRTHPGARAPSSRARPRGCRVPTAPPGKLQLPSPTVSTVLHTKKLPSPQRTSPLAPEEGSRD